MKYLHTMVRVRDVEASLRFYCEGLGLRETRRMENAAGRFTLIFHAAEGQEGIAEVEQTYNWGCRASGQYQASSTWENDV